MRSPRHRPIWLPVVAVVMAIVCVRLGFWQLDRLEGRRAANDAIEAGLAAAPVDVVALLGSAPETRGYRPVSADGSYDRAGERLLYGRPLDGRPGDHVLTPLVLDDGTRILVDRGWIPSSSAPSLPLEGSAAAPEGRVQIRGIAMPSEDRDAFDGVDPSAVTTVRAINVPQIAEVIGAELAPFYVLLEEQRPSQAAPVTGSIGDLGEGPHLSYALQWFAFATIAVVGAVVLRRKASGGSRTR